MRPLVASFLAVVFSAASPMALASPTKPPEFSPPKIMLDEESFDVPMPNSRDSITEPTNIRKLHEVMYQGFRKSLDEFDQALQGDQNEDLSSVKFLHDNLQPLDSNHFETVFADGTEIDSLLVRYYLSNDESVEDIARQLLYAYSQHPLVAESNDQLLLYYVDAIVEKYGITLLTFERDVLLRRLSSNQRDVVSHILSETQFLMMFLDGESISDVQENMLELDVVFLRELMFMGLINENLKERIPVEVVQPTNP